MARAGRGRRDLTPRLPGTRRAERALCPPDRDTAWTLRNSTRRSRRAFCFRSRNRTRRVQVTLSMVRTSTTDGKYRASYRLSPESPIRQKNNAFRDPTGPQFPPRVRATMALAASRFASSRGDEAAAREHVGVRDDTTRAQIKLRAHATMKPPRLRISGCARFALQPRRST